MATTMAVVKAQIDANLKQAAESTLNALGLDMAAGIRMFLHQVVLRGEIPFAVKLPHPNANTLEAIADSYAGRVERVGSVAELFK